MSPHELVEENGEMGCLRCSAVGSARENKKKKKKKKKRNRKRKIDGYNKEKQGKAV